MNRENFGRGLLQIVRRDLNRMAIESTRQNPTTYLSGFLTGISLAANLFPHEASEPATFSFVKNLLETISSVLQIPQTAETIKILEEVRMSLKEIYEFEPESKTIN